MQCGNRGTNDMIDRTAGPRRSAVTYQTRQAIASSGIHTSLINVQNGEQPWRLRPVQSSDEARNPSGMNNNNTALIRRSLALSFTRSRARGLENAFTPINTSESATSPQKGTASIGPATMKSTANLRRRIAAISQAAIISGF